MISNTIVRSALLSIALVTGMMVPAQGAILTTGFFSGTIERFDESTGTQSTFATVAGNPGFSGITYSTFTNQVYVSALNFGGIFTFNGRTGANTGFYSLGLGVAGLAIDNAGNVYVSDFGSNNVHVFNSDFSSSLGTISVPASTATAGVAFGRNGDLMIATAGAGVYRYDGSNVTLFSGQGGAAGQVAVDGDGNVYVGHGLGFSDSVFKLDENGLEIEGSTPGSPFLTISDAMLNGTGSGSSFGTSPSGVFIDSDGNLLVAALGKSNPGDAGGERGGLFKFDRDGNLLQNFATGSSAFSGVVQFTAVPEPGAVAMLAMGAAGVWIRRRQQRNRQSAC
jgi:hypothetical protein